MRERNLNPFKPNTIQQGDGLELLNNLACNSVSLVFFDPQYELSQKVSRIKNYPLIYQNSKEIKQFLKEISRVLEPSRFCFLWISKNLLITGQILSWLSQISKLKIVDLIVWDKLHFGFGSYSRNQTEFAFLIQKYPQNSKNFKNRSFGNVWAENIIPSQKRNHPHQKPRELIRAIIEATTEKGDLIVDPCAGSFIVLKVCQETKRKFIGCDLTYLAMEGFKADKICLKCFEIISDFR